MWLHISTEFPQESFTKLKRVVNHAQVQKIQITYSIQNVCYIYMQIVKLIKLGIGLPPTGQTQLSREQKFRRYVNDIQNISVKLHLELSVCIFYQQYVLVESVVLRRITLLSQTRILFEFTLHFLSVSCDLAEIHTELGPSTQEIFFR